MWMKNVMAVLVLLSVCASVAQAKINCESEDLDFQLSLSTKTCEVRYLTLEYPDYSNDWGNPQRNYDYVTAWDTNCEETSSANGYSYTFQLRGSISVEVDCDQSMKNCSGKAKISDKSVVSRATSSNLNCKSGKKIE